MQQISAFSFYLRTGRRQREDRIEQKYNHWHDPDDGRFTFAGQGKYFGRANTQDQASTRRPLGREISNGKFGSRSREGERADPSRLNGSAPIKLAQINRNPRVRMRGNGGPPLHDPRTLQQVFPGLGNAPGGAIIAVADNLLDLTGPSRRQTSELSEGYANRLVREIQAIDPTFHRSLLATGFPSTSEGQANHINELRLARAKAYYLKGEHRPLQVETLRFLHRKVDEAYELGLNELKAGRLSVRLSAREALGNFVDSKVRRDVRQLYNKMGIRSDRGQLVQVNRRAYHSDGGFSRPDSRVGNVSFDWSLTAKNSRTEQIRNFFRSDFRPDIVVIIRPSKLDGLSVYAITKPSGR